MEIYLLRHGIAHELGEAGAQTDAERTLSPQGKAKMRAAAEGMAQMGLTFGCILSSPLPRAYETAEIVAEKLGLKNHLTATKNLSPGFAPEKLLAEVARFSHLDSVLLVGHEPDLSHFAEHLVGSQSRNLITFKKGSLCRIDVARIPMTVPGVLRWLLTPSQLRLMAGHD